MTDGRSPESICADCSTPNPTWASLNRGVLVCDECCSVHRSLGRHISFIKSLHSVNWSPAVREMVSSLVRKGANSIWEHALHDSSTKVKIKKPNPRDKLHPTKHDFIVAKYKHLALLPRMSLKDSANMSQDLSKQLHASVRTSNLETCLRLLSMGADPNYLHPDRGNTPLHVAAHANQAMQVELLLMYGANPVSLDLLGHTSEECARIAGHHQLADRLVESQYELTDRLSFFLCGRKPMHSAGEHYLIPQGSDLINDAKSEARIKLQQLSNEAFEELASDIYDEVDRRETDAIWLTTQSLQDSVAFLPLNPAISPMRNQGRQKLATLDAKEFSQLVTDMLLDTRRRQNISLETGQRSGTVVPSSGGLVPDHDYDDVAQEEASLSPEMDDKEEEDDLGEVKHRKRSKLTPPVESTYSIIGDTSTPPIVDEHYSHLRTESRSHESEPECESGKGGRRTESTYSCLLSPDPSSVSFSAADTNYSYNMLSDFDKPLPKPRGGASPSLPPRPKTTYERIKGRSSLSSPSPVHGEEETVNKKKFDIIMEQLRKVRKEKDELQTENERLNQKVDELQKQLNKVITENAGIRSSTTPESTTPKSPLSPLPLSSPVPLSPQPKMDSFPQPQTSTESGSVYAAVKKKKPKPVPPVKPPLSKTWSTPPSYKKNPTSPLPHTTSPLSQITTPVSPSAPTAKTLHKRVSETVESPGPINEEKEISNMEDSAFVESYEEKETDIKETPPVVPPHRASFKDVTLPPAPPPKPKLKVSSESTELPSIELVHMEIKNITTCIQELLKAGQSLKHDKFVPCSVKMNETVNKLIGMFPPKPTPKVAQAVNDLELAVTHFKNECQNPSQEDLDCQTRLVMNAAYDIAKAARILVFCVENAQ